MLGPRLGFTYCTTPVSDVQDLFGLLHLHLRRQRADLLLLFRLVSGHIDSPALLSSTNLSIPRRTRSRSIFCRQFHHIGYSYNSAGISRVFRTRGSTNINSDFFHETLASFKRKVTSLVKSTYYCYTVVFTPRSVIAVFLSCLFSCLLQYFIVI